MSSHLTDPGQLQLTLPEAGEGQEPASPRSQEASAPSVSPSEMRQFHRLYDLLEPGGEGERILQARALILCGLPLQRTSLPNVHRVARVGADTTLTVTYSSLDEGVHLPFGADRALASWLQTQAVRNRHTGGVVSFRHISEFFTAFGIEACGIQYRRFRERLARLESLAITLRIETSESVARLNLHFIRRSVQKRAPLLPNSDDLVAFLSGADHRYGIQLDPAFFGYLVDHAVPLPLPLMRLFIDEPKGWDFASFVLYRCYIRGEYALGLQDRNAPNLKVPIPVPPDLDCETLQGLVRRLPFLKLRTLRYWIQRSEPRIVSRNGKRLELPGNGLGPAIIRRGRLTYVDVPLFVEWFNGGRGR